MLSGRLFKLKYTTFSVRQVSALPDFKVDLVEYGNSIGSRLYHIRCDDEH